MKDVSISIREGEILGIAGVEGNGQRELAEIITGLRHKDSGEISILGTDMDNKSIREIRRMGVSHVPEDRMTYGVVRNASISENLFADRYYKQEYQKGILLDMKKLNSLADDLIHEYTVKCDDRNQEIRMLSGGNMQKVVIAREFSSSPRLIIANQPTRGVDVGASEFIRNHLIRMRTNGAAVLLISADLNEVMDVSDRLIVMYGGRIVASFDNPDAITEQEIGEYMLGLKRQEVEMERSGT